MATKTIDANMLAKMFLAGAQNIEAKKEFINELNVFPVPDGDTGTNMTLTILSAAKEVTALADVDMKNLAKAISSGSLRGARGNSGVILSQLLRGFTKSIRDEKEIDTAALAAACQRARDTAYKAVMKPKEGTILTVIKAGAERSVELLMEGESHDMVSFAEEVSAYMEDTLKRTPDMLPVLKQAGVVDSGGEGLMTFVRGALAALQGDEKALADTFADLPQYADYNTGFMDLEAGAIDALALDIGVANYQIASRGSGYVVLDEYLSTEQYGIGFKKGNDELKDTVEKTLLEMADDGTFMEIAEKYADYGLVDSVCLGK